MKQAEQAGATVLMPVEETPMVTFGRVADPDGLVVVKAAEGPGVSSGDNPPVDFAP